jgi:hypothetical protein
VNWDLFLESVKVGGALPVEFAVAHGTVLITMIVPHSGSGYVPRTPVGSPISIHRVVRLPPWPGLAGAADWVRYQVVDFYRHEAEEQITINGVRIFEPIGEH